MSMKLLMAGVAVLGLLAGTPSIARAQQASDPAIHVGAKDIGGVVTSAKGPEAGVWVIAETTDLPTRFIRIVVTDERGRYLLPDLPKASYSLWVRGYGLVDSPKQKVEPGRALDLKATVAPSEAAAAEYYPAMYWYSMLNIPPASAFPGTGPNGNGIMPAIKAQGTWLDGIKTDGCQPCHQLGTKATRTLSPALGHFDRSVDAWMRRISSGQASGNMVNTVNRLGPAALSMFADWTDRVSAGELPKDKPARPQGIERNIVLTVWDWSNPKAYMHDAVSTDKRNPTVNPYGLIYGTTELSTDMVPVLDPVKNVATEMKLPVRDPQTQTAENDPMLAPSIYWGEEKIWHAQTSPHSLVMDERGRVWYTARIRRPDDPAYCKAGSDQASAKLFPLKSSTRQAIMYDPKTQKFTTIDTCFQNQHLNFTPDGSKLYFSSGANTGEVLGWLDVKKFEATGDEAKSQGWAPFILDTNGDGKRSDWVEPNQPVDPAKDKRVRVGLYGVSPDPKDGSVWGSTLGFPGGIVHVIPGANPPETTITEYFEAPWKDAKAPVHGFSPRGMDIDSQGVVWAPLASGHLASFDRRKCSVLRGPTAIGGQCPEGWTLYALPGPQFANQAEPGSVEASYYDWVDQHDTFGLGKDVPIATGNQSDSLLALKDGKWVTLRVPYPMGFFAKTMDGRIDDANAGWKGRGLWATYGERAVEHIEGGKGQTSKVVHFQLRPNPLAN